jgi:hypothetical protein
VKRAVAGVTVVIEVAVESEVVEEPVAVEAEEERDEEVWWLC